MDDFIQSRNNDVNHFKAMLYSILDGPVEHIAQAGFSFNTFAALFSEFVTFIYHFNEILALLHMNKGFF